jgi:hypothetical protein
MIGTWRIRRLKRPLACELRTNPLHRPIRRVSSCDQVCLPCRAEGTANSSARKLLKQNSMRHHFALGRRLRFEDDADDLVLSRIRDIQPGNPDSQEFRRAMRWNGVLPADARAGTIECGFGARHDRARHGGNDHHEPRVLSFDLNSSHPFLAAKCTTFVPTTRLERPARAHRHGPTPLSTSSGPETCGLTDARSATNHLAPRSSKNSAGRHSYAVAAGRGAGGANPCGCIDAVGDQFTA